MTDRKNSGEWQHDGPSLDASGKLVGAKDVPPQPAPSFEPPDEKLELDTSRMQKSDGAYVEPGSYREDVDAQRKRRAAVKAIAVLAVLGIAAAVAFVRIPFLHAIKLQGAARPVIVVSNPAGAIVRINGTVVGATPFAADNHYVGKVTVNLQLDGYEPFFDTFEGGRDVQVAAMLRKKRGQADFPPATSP